MGKVATGNKSLSVTIKGKKERDAVKQASKKPASTTEEGEKRRRKPGSVAISEVKKEQNSVKSVIPFTPIKDIIKFEISKATGSEMRVAKEAALLCRQAIETVIESVYWNAEFTKSIVTSTDGNDGRVSLKERDLLPPIHSNPHLQSLFKSYLTEKVKEIENAHKKAVTDKVDDRIKQRKQNLIKRKEAEQKKARKDKVDEKRKKSTRESKKDAEKESSDDEGQQDSE